jgi:uncharacterized UBP type Zn finger protein
MNVIYRDLSIDLKNLDGKEGVDVMDSDVKDSVKKSLARFFQPDTREITCDKCGVGEEANVSLRIYAGI